MGLTYFFLDMKSPGVEVRPIHQISGGSNFNEVYFTDVRIPDGQRLGEVGEGWRVSLTTLMNERLAVGGSRSPSFNEIYRLAKDLELDTGPAISDSAVRERLADWYVDAQGIKYTQFRTLTASPVARLRVPESSINKVVTARKMQEVSLFALDLLDRRAPARTPNCRL